MLFTNANTALPTAITANVEIILQNASVFAKSQIARILTITVKIIQAVII
jgi:hypothetical protein